VVAARLFDAVLYSSKVFGFGQKAEWKRIQGDPGCWGRTGGAMQCCFSPLVARRSFHTGSWAIGGRTELARCVTGAGQAMR